MPPPPATIDDWSRLLEPEAIDLLEVLRDVDDVDVRLMTMLRRRWPAERVAIAIELATARRRAARKFTDPERLVADVEGVEQATSELVARHKATRFAELAPGRTVHDFCCGIGGDAMSLAGIAPVRVVDIDPLRAWMAGHNAGCDSDVADVTSLALGGECIHIDPSRRRHDSSGTRRSWSLEDYLPGPDVLRAILRACPDAAIKLGPGVDVDALNAFGEGDLEIISERGTLTQAVFWSGALARAVGKRTATLLPLGVSFTARPSPLPFAPLGRYLLVPDPALERADLLGAFAEGLQLAAPHPRLGFLTSDEPVDNPWLRVFEVQAELAWREKKVAEWLAANDGGPVVIKTRGKAVEPNSLQKRLRRKGATEYTIFVLRFDQKIRAIICRAL